jgi:hypothetical protein
VVRTVKKKPRASLTATRQVLASGKVLVSVKSNAKKVKLAYRTAKSKKRTATIKIRKGSGTKLLAKGSKRIKAQAKATKKLRASRWITVLPAAAPKPKPTPTPTPTPLRFSLTGAVGLALGTVGTQAGALGTSSVKRMATDPTLVAVKSDGSTQAAISSGSASVGRFLIAPNDDVYVLFSSPTSLLGSGAGTCLLAQVDRASGVPTCVDSTLSSITWDTGWNTVNPGNDPIQFDSSGAAYYTGMTDAGSAVLRKFAGGSRTDLINEGIQVRDFLVLPDGSVVVIGSTTATGAWWIRRITPQGGIQNLVTGSYGLFLRPFPDGNVYMGLWEGRYGVGRYLTSSKAMDPKFWISGSMAGWTPDRYFDTATVCENADPSLQGAFCGWFGSYIKDAHTTANGHVFVVAGASADGVLMEYYPTLKRVATTVTKISVAQSVESNLALAGLNVADQNVLTRLDTSSGTEGILLGPSNEVEIYHLNHVESSNTLMFDGLRFADNKYVLGRVDLSTNVVSMEPTGSTKLLDFQTW